MVPISSSFYVMRLPPITIIGGSLHEEVFAYASFEKMLLGAPPEEAR